MNRREFVKTASVGLVALAVRDTVAKAESDNPRPNVAFILVDDMRFDQMANMGHPYIKTPNLDRLVREGVKFTNAYVTTPLCGPVRGSIVTGRQASAHMRRDNAVYPANLDPYIPRFFHDDGYRSAMIGKFYEGKDLRSGLYAKVFDRWFLNGGPVFPKEGIKTPRARRQYRDEHLYYDQMYDIDGKHEQVKGHQTDVLFAEAARFATERKDKPFFMFVSPFAPHAPHNPTLRRKGKYAGKGIPQKPNMEMDKVDEKLRERLPETYARTCEMIEDVDEGIGRLLDALEKNGQLDNTIVIFSSDNGVCFGEHGFVWKRHPWQESIKIPLIVRYPKLARPGTVCSALVSLADVLVTCADIAGIKLPSDDMRYGRSFMPLLTGQEDAIHDDLLVIQYPTAPKDTNVPPEGLYWATLLTKDYKLTLYNADPHMHPELGREFLYNIAADPYEAKNLAHDEAHREVRQELTARLRELLKQNHAQCEWVK